MTICSFDFLEIADPLRSISYQIHNIRSDSVKRKYFIFAKTFFMKPFLFSTVLSLFPLFSFGQLFVGNVDINSADSVQVIEVYIDRGTFGKSVRAYVDFGQRDNSMAQNVIGRNDNMLITEPVTGEKKVFKSTAAVLNYLESNQWEHYHGLIETVKGTSTNFYYYFRKRTVR
jgi:hypothetical protein